MSERASKDLPNGRYILHRWRGGDDHFPGGPHEQLYVQVNDSVVTSEATNIKRPMATFRDVTFLGPITDGEFEGEHGHLPRYDF